MGLRARIQIRFYEDRSVKEGEGESFSIDMGEDSKKKTAIKIEEAVMKMYKRWKFKSIRGRKKVAW